MEVEVYRVDNPTYFLISVLNPEQQDAGHEPDRITTRVKQLPEGLSANETDMKKFKRVFKEKLNIVWFPRADWLNDLPTLQDVFIDTTRIVKQTIHKIVEVKVRKLDADRDSDEEDEDFEALQPGKQIECKRDAQAIRNAFNHLRAEIYNLPETRHTLRRNLERMSEESKSNGLVTLEIFKQVLVSYGVVIKVDRDQAMSAQAENNSGAPRVDERARLTAALFSAFVSDRSANSVRIDAFCSVLQRGTMPNLKRLITAHYQAKEPGRKKTKEMPAYEKAPTRSKEKADWELEDWSKEPMVEEATINLDISKPTSAGEKGAQALARIYVAEDARKDEYYFSLTVFTNQGRHSDAIDKARFGPRFIKRADMTREDLKLGSRTKFNVAQALKRILKKELESQLRVLVKDSSNEWVGSVRKELAKHYGI